jgi:cytochrome c-type biogenesis protein CcmE
MKKRTRTRLILVLIGVLSISTGIYFILRALSDNIVFYYPPSQIPKDTHFKLIRIGGLVKEKSVKKIDLKIIEFTLTDNKSEILVSYSGILPNLFRENQGIIAKGTFNGGIFKAESLLTKHDETYKPKTSQIKN